MSLWGCTLDAETLEHMGILGAEGAQTPANARTKDTETFDTASIVRLKHDDPTQAKLVS